MNLEQLLESTHDLHDAIVKEITVERAATVEVCVLVEAEWRGSGQWRRFELIFSSVTAFSFREPTCDGVVFQAGYALEDGLIHFSFEPKAVPAQGDRFTTEDLRGSNYSVSAKHIAIREWPSDERA